MCMTVCRHPSNCMQHHAEMQQHSFHLLLLLLHTTSTPRHAPLPASYLASRMRNLSLQGQGTFTLSARLTPRLLSPSRWPSPGPNLSFSVAQVLSLSLTLHSGGPWSDRVVHHDQAASASLIVCRRGVDLCLCFLDRTNPLLFASHESTLLRSSGLCFLDRMNPLLARRVSIFSRCARIFIFFSGWVVHHD